MGRLRRNGELSTRWLTRENCSDRIVCGVAAGQFLNEMQEVGELSPAVSPVKSLTGNASAFAPVARQEEATASGGITADSSPAADAAGPETAQHAAPLEPSGEANAHGLHGGSADDAAATGGPLHAASGELEGTEHLHSGAREDAPTVGSGGDDSVSAEAAAMADRVALVAACLKAEASAHTGPLQLCSNLAAASSARSSGVVEVDPGAHSVVDVGGQQASNGIDHSGDMVTDAAVSEARSASGQDKSLPTGAAPAAATVGQTGPGLSTMPAQEQQFTCKVCDITTSTETHMQVRPPPRPVAGSRGGATCICRLHRHMTCMPEVVQAASRILPCMTTRHLPVLVVGYLSISSSMTRWTRRG